MMEIIRCRSVFDCFSPAFDVKETGYYDLLGVHTRSSPDDLEKAYLNLKFHYYFGPPSEFRNFWAITEAYKVLSNTGLRKHYDMGGEKAVHELKLANQTSVDYVLDWLHGGSKERSRNSSQHLGARNGDEGEGAGGGGNAPVQGFPCNKPHVVKAVHDNREQHCEENVTFQEEYQGRSRNCRQLRGARNGDEGEGAGGGGNAPVQGFLPCNKPHVVKAVHDNREQHCEENVSFQEEYQGRSRNCRQLRDTGARNGDEGEGAGGEGNAPVQGFLPCSKPLVLKAVYDRATSKAGFKLHADEDSSRSFPRRSSVTEVLSSDVHFQWHTTCQCSTAVPDSGTVATIESNDTSDMLGGAVAVDSAVAVADRGGDVGGFEALGGRAGTVGGTDASGNSGGVVCGTDARGSCSGVFDDINAPGGRIVGVATSLTARHSAAASITHPASLITEEFRLGTFQNSNSYFARQLAASGFYQPNPGSPSVIRCWFCDGALVGYDQTNIPSYSIYLSAHQSECPVKKIVENDIGLKTGFLGDEL